jgi:glycosyltransferase involved in cell wall biosynthesis
LKVLHISAAYKPAYIYGGPTMSVAALCEDLVKAGINVEVFTTTANGAEELPVETGKTVLVDSVNVKYFKRITKDHTHLSPSLLTTLWKEARSFDLIHIHAWWNLVSVLACFIAHIRKVPVLISPRGMLTTYTFNNRNSGVKGIIHKLLGASLLRKSNIHTTSLKESEAVKAIVNPLSITTIPNFVKLSQPVYKHEKEFTNGFKLLFLSRIEEKKGLDILIKSLKNITAPYHLTIAGDGRKEYINQLKALAYNNEISSNITWAGFYGDDKFDLLRKNHLLVLPSHDENFGNVVVESLSVGTAVLISEHVGLADYILKNNLGWICKSEPESISDAINNIKGNQINQLKNIQTIAPSKIHEDFTGDKLTGNYIALYQKIIANERL